MNRLAHGARLCAGQGGASRSSPERCDALRLVFDTKKCVGQASCLPVEAASSLVSPSFAAFARPSHVSFAGATKII